ncbi:MAG TPA: hypothetical protein VFP81_01555 [Propionibacteriaceae bacterium]|nr:hypothetical protein [Propionibacteriaceae bacterium]
MTVVAAIESRPAAPPAAPSNLPIQLDHEVRPVVNQLCVQAHDRVAGPDLRVVEESQLQLVDRSLNQRQQHRQVLPAGQATGQDHVCAPIIHPRNLETILVSERSEKLGGRLTDNIL